MSGSCSSRPATATAFDNLSGLPPWLSDTLCRLTSGGAFSTRRLFSDRDEILFTAARRVILNGIEDIITPRSCRPRYPTDARTDCRNGNDGRSMRFGGSSSSPARTPLARSSMRPRMGYACCRGYASSGCRAWPTRAHFDPRDPRNRLCQQPARHDREYHRRGSSSGPCARDHSRQSTMEG
jgi:hypothetical protein